MNKQSGVVTVLFTFWIFILFGLVALVVDYGRIISKEIALQQAMDSAVFSFTSEKLKGSQPADPQQFMEDFIHKSLRGYDVTNLTVHPVVVTEHVVQLNVDWDYKFWFAPVLVRGITGGTFGRSSHVETPPVNLAVVADRSGSMSPVGAPLLDTPLNRMIMQIDAISQRLRETVDRLALFTHADSAETVVPFQGNSEFDKSFFSTATLLSTLSAGNHTSLGSGLHLAVDALGTLPPSTPAAVNAIFMMGDGVLGGMDPLNLDPTALTMDPITGLPLLPPNVTPRGDYVYRLYSNGNCGNAEDGGAVSIPPLGVDRVQSLDIDPVSETFGLIETWGAPPFTVTTCGVYPYNFITNSFETIGRKPALGWAVFQNNGIDCDVAVPDWTTMFNPIGFGLGEECMSQLKILHADPALRGIVDVPAWPILNHAAMDHAKYVQALLEADYARRLGYLLFYSTFGGAGSTPFLRRLVLDPEVDDDAPTDLSWVYNADRVPQPDSQLADPTVMKGAVIDSDSAATLYQTVGSIMWSIQVRWVK